MLMSETMADLKLSSTSPIGSQTKTFKGKTILKCIFISIKTHIIINTHNISMLTFNLKFSISLIYSCHKRLWTSQPMPITNQIKLLKVGLTVLLKWMRLKLTNLHLIVVFNQKKKMTASEVKSFEIDFWLFKTKIAC